MKRLVATLTGLPRGRKRAVLVSFDVCALAATLCASFALRYGQGVSPRSLVGFLVILSAPVIAFSVFVRLALYRAVIRCLPERALWSILQATTLAHSVLGARRFSFSIHIPVRGVPLGADPVLGARDDRHWRESICGQETSLARSKYPAPEWTYCHIWRR